MAIDTGSVPATTDEDPFVANCPGRTILDHLTSRWAVLILCSLSQQERRFSELRARIGGVSEKMLSQTLRTLSHDGLVTRSVIASTPPRVSYALTPLGRQLATPMQGLVAAIRSHAPAIVAVWGL